MSTTGKRKGSPTSETSAGTSKKQKTHDFPVEYIYSSIKDIPLALRAKVVSKFSVEFIDLVHGLPGTLGKHDIEGDFSERVNHCVAKLEFKNIQEKYAGHVPEGSTGIKLDLVLDMLADTRCGRGDLTVKAVSYSGPHKHARKVVEIPIRNLSLWRGNHRRQTVGDFLRVIDQNNLVPCGFNMEAENTVGCKDFMSQYINRLNQAGVLDINDQNRDEIYRTFNYTYGASMNRQCDGSVGYASFNTAYHAQHLPINGLNYTGNRICFDSAEAKEEIF